MQNTQKLSDAKARQIQGLKPYQSGSAWKGNAGGLPKHGRIDSICRDYLDAIDPNDPLKRERKIALVAAVYEVATGRADPYSINMQAVQWLSDRGWGKPTETHEVYNHSLSVEVIRKILTTQTEVSFPTKLT